VPNRKDSVIDRVAKIRGIEDPQRFLNPTKEELHSPYLMKNMEKAAERIATAIVNKERIVVSYDPDTDGLASATIMIRYLRRNHAMVDYIYGQRGSGHGIDGMVKLKKDDDSERDALNRQNIEKILDADLLILVDSSSNDVKSCKKIAEREIDVIVLDHHGIEEENPYVTLVNPQQDGCEYPNKHLSGAGVVFKTLQVVEEVLQHGFGMGGNADPFDYIDLVAVGMYGDVMRVDVPENRYLIMEGMRNMKNPGLVRILKSGKADLFKINCASIAFTISPLLNAVARMDRLELAIDMLLAEDDKDCQKIQREMKKVNEVRKIRQKEITEQYEVKIDPSKKVLIVIDEHSSRGFNGIVAQQLSDRFKRPVIVGRRHKGEISGSFRSFNDFQMRSFLKEFGNNIEAVGHEPAGGVTVKEELLHQLEAYIDSNMPELSKKEQVLEYDFEIEVGEVGKYVKAVEQFNLLYGNGFDKITTRVNGICVDEAKIIGASAETCKVSTFDSFELIKFRVPESYGSDLECFDNISAVGQLQINEFYNFHTKKKTITNQMIIEDYKRH
jgi:single-stranded-DNA-specific exonuclease